MQILTSLSSDHQDSSSSFITKPMRPSLDSDVLALVQEGGRYSQHHFAPFLARLLFFRQTTIVSHTNRKKFLDLGGEKYVHMFLGSIDVRKAQMFYILDDADKSSIDMANLLNYQSHPYDGT